MGVMVAKKLALKDSFSVVLNILSRALVNILDISREMIWCMYLWKVSKNEVTCYLMALIAAMAAFLAASAAFFAALFNLLLALLKKPVAFSCSRFCKDLVISSIYALNLFVVSVSSCSVGAD